MSKSTITDVAELAGVSIKTVSRVVNEEPNVRDVTRDKVNLAISQLNYKPNLSARNLASHRTNLMVLIYDDPDAYLVPSAGYIIKMQQGALRACRSKKHELLIHPCNYRNTSVGQELKTLIQQVRPAGVILAAPLSNMPNIVGAIASTDTPFVRLSPGNKNGNEFSVATNDREISAEMTRYLASMGHSKIAFITGHPTHRAVANRFMGYKDGLEQSGLKFNKQLVGSGDNSLGSGEIAAAKLLNRKRRPTAIFAANDDMAAGVIRMADRLNIKIPEQLSVAGCDDIALARLVYPAMTTIRQPLAVMAEQATIALIDNQRDSEPLKGLQIVPGELQIRDSTGPAPA
jgi:LacI family transcriptional regulator